MKKTETNILVHENSIPGNLFDLSMLEEMDDNEYLLEMINIFLWEAPKELKEMSSFLRTGKYVMVSQIAHKIKSNAGIIQAKKFSETLDRIEITGKKEGDHANIIALAKIAQQQYNEIEAGLEEYIKANGLK